VTVARSRAQQKAAGAFEPAASKLDDLSGIRPVVRSISFFECLQEHGERMLALGVLIRIGFTGRPTGPARTRRPRAAWRIPRPIAYKGHGNI
jgi:hypothetical protein